MKLKHLGAATLAALTLGQPIISQAKTVENKTISSTANKEMKQGAEVTKKRKDSLPDMIGGHEMVNIGGYGIPPHIYGMQYVRKGTHKRTNKPC
jgi:hypothetical protein